MATRTYTTTLSAHSSIWDVASWLLKIGSVLVRHYCFIKLHLTILVLFFVSSVVAPQKVRPIY